MCFGCGRTEAEICEYNDIMFKQNNTFNMSSVFQTQPQLPMDTYRNGRAGSDVYNNSSLYRG